MFFFILLPFFVLAVGTFVLPVGTSLLFAALVAAGVVIRDLLRGGGFKLLNVATFVLFAGLGLMLDICDAAPSAPMVRIVINGGLLAVALTSLGLRAPFTLQFARDQVSAETAARPQFRRAMYVLSWTWAGSFALMLGVDVVALLYPQLPVWSGLAVTFATRNAAVQFTKWYAERARAAAQA